MRRRRKKQKLEPQRTLWKRKNLSQREKTMGFLWIKDHENEEKL